MVGPSRDFSQKNIMEQKPKGNIESPIVEVYAMKIERDGVYRYRLQLDRTCYG